MLLFDALMCMTVYFFGLGDAGDDPVEMFQRYVRGSLLIVALYSFMFLPEMCDSGYAKCLQLLEWGIRQDTLKADAICAICLESMPSPATANPFWAILTVRMLRCKHAFHRRCIAQWVMRNPSCPLCRRVQG